MGTWFAACTAALHVARNRPATRPTPFCCPPDTPTPVAMCVCMPHWWLRTHEKFEISTKEPWNPIKVDVTKAGEPRCV